MNIIVEDPPEPPPPDVKPGMLPHLWCTMKDVVWFAAVLVALVIDGIRLCLPARKAPHDR